MFGRDALVEEGLGLVDVPDEEVAAVADRGQPLAVGAEGDGVDVVGMPVELVQLLAVGDVPDPDRLVDRPGRELAPVGVEGERSRPSPPWPWLLRSSLPSATFQYLISLSSPPVARRSPLGLKATA